MRPLATLIILTIFAQNVLGQAAKKYDLPGFVQLNDTLFVSKTEISIRNYAAFLLYLNHKEKDSAVTEQALPIPNTTDWTIWSSYSKKLITFDQPIFEIHDTTVSFTSVMGYLPVVNVSKRQATDYCNFRRVDYDIYIKKAKSRVKKKLPSNLFFRLLTEAEWKEAAGFTGDTSNVVCNQFFLRNLPNEKRPLPVYHGSKNSLGLFNMVGNVAELVSDTDKAFGGSFRDNLQDCNTEKSSALNFGEHCVGFRVAAVVR
jgi:formylglycine-generating enzyme required for sulfatase activity